MEFSYFSKDIKKFRKTYNKKLHIDSLYLKHNNDINDSKKILIVFLFLIFIFFILFLPLSNPFLFLIVFFIAFFSILSIAIINAFFESSLLKTYASNFIKNRIFTNYLINKKINKFFHKNVNKEELKLIKNITKIEYTIKEEKIKNYLKENKKRLFEAKYEFYRRAINKSSVNYFDIIKYIIKNSNDKQLKKMDRNSLEELIKPLTIDDKIEITNLIKEFKEKENKLEENLNFIDNKEKKHNKEEIII